MVLFLAIENEWRKRPAQIYYTGFHKRKLHADFATLTFSVNYDQMIEKSVVEHKSNFVALSPSILKHTLSFFWVKGEKSYEAFSEKNIISAAIQDLL